MDSHALHALLLVMGAGRGVGAAADEDGLALLGCLEAMLRCDPGNEVAISGVCVDTVVCLFLPSGGLAA